MKCNLTIRVKGMTCGGCASTVREAVQHVPGVESADVDYKTGYAEIYFDDTFADPGKIASAINATGYEALVPAAL